MRLLLETSGIIFTSEEKIERGLQDIEEGKVVRQEEIERRMSKWLKK